MAEMVNFTKMHGIGNDFVIIDCRDGIELNEIVAKKIANRRFGIGCDQIILLKNPLLGNDILLEFINNDGSLSSACGNGIRPPACPWCPLRPGPPAAAAAATAAAAAAAARTWPAADAWPVVACLFSGAAQPYHVCSRSTRRRACCACRTSRRSSRSGCAGPSYRHPSPSHSHRQGPIAGL